MDEAKTEGPFIIPLPPGPDGKRRRIYIFLPRDLFVSDKKWIQKWFKALQVEPDPAPAEPQPEAPQGGG